MTLKPEFADVLRQWQGKHLTVVANRGKSGPAFAEHLVRLGYPLVSVLRDGASGLRAAGLLKMIGTAPTPVSSPNLSMNRAASAPGTVKHRKIPANVSVLPDFS